MNIYSRMPTMRPFLVYIHDATPANAHETRVMIRFDGRIRPKSVCIRPFCSTP